MTRTADERPPQVVGIDGSDCSLHALRWALARTEQLGPVEPVMAWHYPWWALVPTATGTTMPPTETEFAAIADKIAERALQRVDAERCLQPLVIHGPPGPTLVAAAEHGGLLVVGSRGRGAVKSGVLGSASLYCVHHGNGPVAVVPLTAAIGDEHQRVIVGVDGSNESVTALRWAVDNTRPASRIDVVHAWRNDAASAGVTALADARLAELSADLVADAISQVQPGVQGNGHVLEGRSVQGDARQVLRDLGADSDLVVVGARGETGLVHRLLGSTATSLVHQPEAATIVVR